MGINVVAKLHDWGNWARDDGERLGYRSPMLLLMNLKRQVTGKHRRYAITDDEAMVISKHVATLQKVAPRQSAVIHLYYVGGYNLRGTAEKLGELTGTTVSYHQARELLHRAEGFIAGLAAQE